MTQQEEDFKRAHGARWAKILQLQSFNAGLTHLSIQAMERIRLLSDDEITRNAVTILSELRGQLRYQQELLSLPIIEEETSGTELREEYVDAVDENFSEHMRATNLLQKPN